MAIPSIKLVLSASKKELNAELEELDPYDAGIFRRKDSPIDNWKIVAACSKIEIVQSRTKFLSDLSIKLDGLKVKEEANDAIRVSGKNKRKERKFGSLLKCDKGLRVGVQRLDRACKSYDNEDMTISLHLEGALLVNWQPLVMNRLVRFLRFMKFKSTVMKLEL